MAVMRRSAVASEAPYQFLPPPESERYTLRARASDPPWVILADLNGMLMGTGVILLLRLDRMGMLAGVGAERVSSCFQKGIIY